MIIDAATGRILSARVDSIESQVINLGTKIEELDEMLAVHKYAKEKFIPAQVDADTEANAPSCYSIQRHVSQDQLYLNGMVVPSVVNPALSEFATGSDQYLVCVRHNVSGGVPTVKWATMQAAISASPDIYVKASPDDGVPGVLYGADADFNKLSPGAGITLTVNGGAGGAASVAISVTPGGHNQEISTITVSGGGDDHDFLYVDGTTIAHVPFITAMNHTNPGSGVGSSSVEMLYWRNSTWQIGLMQGAIYGTLDEAGYVTSSDYFVVNASGDKYQMVVEHGLIKQFVAA